MSPASPKLSRLKTVFISDVHRGFRACQADYLLAFLNQLHTEQRVPVGDIVGLWSLKRSLYWPLSYQAVLRAILRLARTRTKVVFVPGKHDEEFRDLRGGEIAGIDIRRDFIHETADGKRYLVRHDDDVDGAVQFSGWLKEVGERLYDGVLWLGRIIQASRRRLGFGYGSLASWTKHQVPDARHYFDRFESAAAHAALKHGLDGVIGGHIHRPAIREVDGVRFCDDGDGVEHCSALVEDRNGRLSILRWTGAAEGIGRETAPPVRAPVVALDTAA